MSIVNPDLHYALVANRIAFSNEIKNDFDDFTLIPDTLTTISSRKEVNPHIKIGNKEFLPLMTAPMDTVVDLDNLSFFHENKILVCLPRTQNCYSTHEPIFPSISLNDAYVLLNEEPNPDESYFCIDMANGHMETLFKTVKELADKRPDIKLIVGNIANPQTYNLFASLDNVWGVRVGIGGGGACTTSANVAVHYPMASLIEECYRIKSSHNHNTKIIADGGMRKYSDIIKALALGADIVMIGSLFNKTLQSCSTTYLWKTIPVSGSVEKWLFNKKFKLYKKFRGMSTKEVQKDWGKKKLTTSEGIVKWNEVIYDLPKWSENFEDYLKSAMSYTSSYNLEEFKDSLKVVISTNAFRRFDK